MTETFHNQDLTEIRTPHDTDAEQIVLGTMMMYPSCIDQVREMLDAEAFYEVRHGYIFDAICDLATAGSPVNPAAVRQELLHEGLAQRVGDAPYLHTLIARAAIGAQASYWAERIQEAATRRGILAAAQRLATAIGVTAPEDLTELLRIAMAELRTAAAGPMSRWPEPIPLNSARVVPGFPIWTLPGVWGEYVAALAESTQTPVDLPGSLALAILSTACAGRIWVRANGWTEPGCLYLTMVLEPGSRKSEVFGAMTAPIRAAETHLVDSSEATRIEAQIAKSVAEADAAKAAAKAASADRDNRDTAIAEAADAQAAADKITVPEEPTLFTANATVEALTSLAAKHGGKMAVLAPEGKIFSILAGLYSGKADLEVLLSGHAGEGMRIDRTGRTRERIAHVTITVGVCIQPGVLTRLGDNEQFRDEGLLARILYSMPPSLIGWRKEEPDPMPAALADAYHKEVYDMVVSLFALDEPITLHFTDDALRDIVKLQAETERRFRPGEDLAHLRDWGGKLVGAIVRIAGLLHIAKHLRDGYGRPIEADTLAKAIELGQYYTGHAQAAFDLIGADPAVRDARTILEWITRNERSSFKARDILPDLRGRFRNVTDLERGLELLGSCNRHRHTATSPSQHSAKYSKIRILLYFAEC
ncbi:MAG: hypothetical protein AUG49_19635 [Catenulispora sp. 13_1_20CM_3_70_7]|nr:MAG: hypothetical protein AUG49_19635 [Catenulispora sp. 13_1_20CM_3_70_7]